MADRFLPGVPGAEIERAFRDAPGNEIDSGKFDHPESSAALAVNAFGWFLNRPQALPPLPECARAGWPARSLSLERTVRFPWRGGRHPVLDALVTTRTALIGIESKRFEPFRGGKRVADLSEAYRRPVWGHRMTGYENVRDRLSDGFSYRHLDAAQLFKHAFALRTAVHDSTREHHGLTPILLYMYAEPTVWPTNRKPVDSHAIATHREEIRHFADTVANDEVRFIACSYRALLADWSRHRDPAMRAHAAAVMERFAP